MVDWLIFMAGLALLLLEMWAFSRIFPAKGGLMAKIETIDELPPRSSSENRLGERSGGLFRPPQSDVVIFLLGVTLLATPNVDFREKVPKPIRISRAFIEKNGARQLTYYWFPQRGRVLNNMFELTTYAFWDDLTKRRTDGALVRLMTPVYEGERPQDAEAWLTGFARQIVPILDTFLPRGG